jgi:hypothetical protein
MGIAYTKDTTPLHVRNIQGANASQLLFGLDSALRRAGLQSTEIDDGYEYYLYSDQGPEAKVRITDAGTPPGGIGRLNVRFRSFDDARIGVPHPLLYAAGRVYEIVASHQQIAISLTGYSSDQFDGSGQWGNSVIGGIPFVQDYAAGFCLEESEPVEEEDAVTEAWWSSGSGNSSLISVDEGFRVNWRHYQHNGFWDGCWNGQYSGGFASDESALRLCVRAHSGADFLGGVDPEMVQHLDGTPLYLEPLLMWGDHNGAVARVRGQMWDALLASKHRDLEDQIQTSEFDPDSALLLGNFDWRNYMSSKLASDREIKGSWYCALYLLIDVEKSVVLESNYVY